MQYNDTRAALRRVSGSVGASVSALLVAATSVHAQSNTHGDSAVYARYTPFACGAIAQRNAAIAVRDDKLAGRDLHPDSDSVAVLHAERARHAATVAEVRTCLARHRIGDTRPAQLIGLGRAYLAADDDVQAEATFRRVLQLGAEKSVLQRSWELQLIIESYVDTTSARLARALAYTAQLDALGAPAAASRVAVHNALYGVAATLDSLPFMETQAQAALKASNELIGDAQRQWAWSSFGAVQNHADLEASRQNYAEAIAILERAQDKLGPLRSGISDFLKGSIKYRYAMYGTPAAKVQSMFSYVPGQPMSKTPPDRPTPGKVSLLVFVDMNCGEICYPLYTLALRLQAKYAPRGLEITLVTRTSGVDRDRLVAKVGDEAALMREYFHDFLKIPIPLAIWTATFQKNPIDGSLSLVTPNPNKEAYYETRMALVDKAGRIREIDGSGKRLDREIEALLAEP